MAKRNHSLVSFDQDCFVGTLRQARVKQVKVEMDTEFTTLEEIVQGMLSNDMETKIRALKTARQMLCFEGNTKLISQMIDAGILKIIISMLDHENNNDLLFEATWVIANITSGTTEHTKAIIDAGAIPKLISFLSLYEVGENCAWAISNIASEGVKQCDLMLSHGALNSLMYVMTPTLTTNQLRTVAWAYRSLSRHINSPAKLSFLIPTLPFAVELLNISDYPVLEDMCRALWHIAVEYNGNIDAMQYTPDLMQRLMKLMHTISPAVAIYALRAASRMLIGTPAQLRRCVRVGMLGHLGCAMKRDCPELVEIAASTVGRLLAGTESQIQRVVDAGLLKHLVNLLSSNHHRCQREAAKAIKNLMIKGTTTQITVLLDLGFLQPYCRLLDSSNYDTVLQVLDGLIVMQRITTDNGQDDILRELLVQFGALESIENLTNKFDEQIKEKALNIILTFVKERKVRGRNAGGK